MEKIGNLAGGKGRASAPRKKGNGLMEEEARTERGKA